ncbi:MAG: hypothetical protein Q8K70_05695 [Bacteroidota bacterium]|nr:hypothetical protein [Bacteroidota bacterium]
MLFKSKFFQWIIAIIFFAGIQIVVYYTFFSKEDKDQEKLLKKTIELERLNISLTREAFENYPFKENMYRRQYYFDTLKSVLDSSIFYYPQINTKLIKDFGVYTTKLGFKDSFEIVKNIFESHSKEDFELKTLTFLNKVGKETFRRPKSICGSLIYASRSSYETPLGVPLPVYIGMWGYGSLDLSKNLKTNIKLDIDSKYNYMGYLPADKLGNHVFEGSYSLNYLGEKVELFFDPVYYHVTEPKIITKLIDKEFLDINKDNIVQFDFGLYKSKDIVIKAEGASIQIIKYNKAIVHPTNKYVKISFELNKDGKKTNLGYKAYIAK